MKKILLLVLVLVILLSTACVQVDESDVIPKMSEEEREMPTASPSPTLNSIVQETNQPTGAPSPTLNSIVQETSKPTATPLILLEPITAEPGANIPDIITDTTHDIVDSDDGLYVDENYIYFYDSYSMIQILYIMNKDNGSIVRTIEGCDEYTINNGMVYYADWGGSEIYRYDIKNYSTTIIMSIENGAFGIDSVGDKLYYLSWELDNEKDFVLYSCNLDGTNIQKICDDLQMFELYENRIFGITMGEVGNLVECFDDREPQMLSGREYDPPIRYSLGNIFLYERNNANQPRLQTLYNIKTGEVKFTPYHIIRTPVGQYLIYYEVDEDDNPTVLKAYDFLENIEYTLMDISFLFEESYRYVRLHSHGSEIFLEVVKDEKTELYKVIINDGKADIGYWITLYR